MTLRLRRQPGRRTPRTARSTTLKCRRLEDRTTPSTYTVNTLQDTADVPGLFSLRDAIHVANHMGGVNVINFAGGLQGVIGLHTALEPITSNLTIDGGNVITVGRVIPLSGGDDPPPPPPPKFRIFEINAGVAAML
jgi:hypothetical protein